MADETTPRCSGCDETQVSEPFDDWREEPSCGLVPITIVQRPPDPDEWFCLADPDPLTGRSLARVMTELSATRGYSDARAKGSRTALFLSDILLVLALRLLDDATLPELDPNQTWIALDSWGHTTGIAHVGCPLPVPQPDLPTLSRLSRRLLDPSFDAIRRHTHVSHPAQWSQCLAALAEVMLVVQHRTSEQVHTVLDAFSASEDLFRRARPRTRTLEVDGESLTYPTRRVCCFEYLSEDAFCGYLCPLMSKPERDADYLRALETGDT